MRRTLPTASSSHEPSARKALGLRVLERVQEWITRPPPMVVEEHKPAIPQFPGVDFHRSGVTLTEEAPESDDAIRASLIWFKHRWPEELASSPESWNSACACGRSRMSWRSA
jgi:hypothetical protein